MKRTRKTDANNFYETCPEAKRVDALSWDGCERFVNQFPESFNIREQVLFNLKGNRSRRKAVSVWSIVAIAREATKLPRTLDTANELG